MKKEELAARYLNACQEVLNAEDELTRIDAQFGDADHGLTMAKIAKAIAEAVKNSEGSIADMTAEAADAVMTLNGGSAVPLWNTWLDGIHEGAPDSNEADLNELKKMFASGFDAINDLSGAERTDKTMMDALIPASEAIAAAENEDALFDNAAAAAAQGAEDTKKYTAKYGRAKSYGEKTIGTPDAGAVSMACFFKGLAEK